MHSQPDRDRERFAELIWTQGDQILDDLGRLRAFLADRVRDESRRDVLFAAISRGMARDIQRCRSDDFLLRKGHWAHKLQHFASEYAEWAIDTLSYAIGPGFDPERPYQKARTLAPDTLIIKLGELTEQEQRSLKLAAHLFLRAAEAGHSDACVWYSEMLRLGKGVEENSADAVVWVRRAAEHGHTTAQATLGRTYLLDAGVEKSVESAIEWLTLAAEGGDAEAQYQLAEIYSWQSYGLVDLVKSDRWLLQAANQNHERAILDMGKRCEEKGDIAGACAWYKELEDSRSFNTIARQNIGSLCEEQGDIPGAIEWYKKIADSGDELGYMLLGNLYKRQNDISTALNWYEKLVHSDRVTIGAGLLFDHGCTGDIYGDILIDGSIDERTEALNLYQAGSQAGCGICASRLRDIRALQATVTHTKGFEPPDLEQPQIEWDDLDESMEKAAEQGHPNAQFNLGLLYAKGQRVEQDYGEAALWFRKAAEQGHVGAQFKLAEMLLAGANPAESTVLEAQSEVFSKAPESDVTAPSTRIASPAGAMPSIRIKRPLRNYDAVQEAISLLKNAAASGHPTAPIHLAEIYSEGIYSSGIYRDSSESLRWYLTAAKNGNFKAMCKIADLYMNGGVDSIGAANAVHWYREAATRGDVGSQLALADVLYYGIKRRDRETLRWYSTGKPIVDEAEAIVWYCTAVENGHPDSIEKLESVIRNGVEYGDGEDVREWLQRAAEEGHDAAKCRLEMVNKLIASANAELDEYEL